jgi:type IV secretory pathway TraG/TraD family ATPase VirD4
MILVSKIQMAAMKRDKMAKEERQDFYLYIDEFQNYVTDSIESILSEARKYRLSLNIAHQYL